MPPPSDAAEGGHKDGAAAHEAIIYVNGSRHVLPAGRGDATLLQYLRGEQRKKTGHGDSDDEALSLTFSTPDEKQQQQTTSASRAASSSAGKGDAAPAP